MENFVFGVVYACSLFLICCNILYNSNSRVCVLVRVLVCAYARECVCVCAFVSLCTFEFVCVCAVSIIIY